MEFNTMMKTGILCALVFGVVTGFNGVKENNTNENALLQKVSGTGKHPATTSSTPSQPEKRITAERFGQVFLEGKFGQIYKQMSESFRNKVSEDELKAIGTKFNQGVKSYAKQSEIPSGKGITRYIWVDDQNKVGIINLMDKKGTITGLQIIPLQPHPETDEKLTKTAFQYPFRGEWYVGWGGTNELVNYHYAFESQRYAYDLLIEKNGRTYKGAPEKNESYYAFGQEVLAPAAGKVVRVVNDIPDNEPVGQMNAKQPEGNYVVIDHGNKEYGVLLHFRKGSIRVKVGDQVKQGDVLGECGNSGNSSEAHIHFQVSDGPELDKAKSLRIRFADGRNPVQSERIKP
ncbi:M23 family metallopeptidase [Paenibacillus sp. DMB20]|uniref:M23 family metallopeptidase n=1 Tax=Paenibacillus sp. DMB20 TaxID=1642570 RepID=UPI000AF4ED31|nr:M23 family metallopeptidase [Paenibacillus sp. DMB20]